jgi:hypothetical protein
MQSSPKFLLSEGQYITGTWHFVLGSLGLLCVNCFFFTTSVEVSAPIKGKRTEVYRRDKKFSVTDEALKVLGGCAIFCF